MLLWLGYKAGSCIVSHNDSSASLCVRTLCVFGDWGG